jgi:nucleotide-binding universal stress UspA family protein
MWSVPPSRILVPLDFGEASGRAVEVAAAVAARTGAHVQLLHAEVLDVPAYFTADQMEALERERTTARARAGEFVADFARRHGASSFDTVIVEGAPTQVIVAAAERADLVVMGTHGRRGPARWWMGSVAERVTHAARTPVLVVRAEPTLSPEAMFQHPMLVSTGNPPDADVLRVAKGLARAFGGTIIEGAVTCEADLTSERRASLVVVARRDRHGVLLGHPAEQWLRHCPLPMLFVPAPESKTAEPESLEQGPVIH